MNWSIGKDRLASDYKLDPSEISLKVVEAMPTILNMHDRNDAAKAERYLRKTMFDLVLKAPIVEVAPDHIKLKEGSTIQPTHWSGQPVPKELAMLLISDWKPSVVFRLVCQWRYMEAKG